MTERLNTLAEVAAQYDAIVFDQWGVLHNGRTPYPKAIETVRALLPKPLAVLSNSGKRSDLNAARIASVGFDVSMFQSVMTSGEALWQEIAQGAVPERRFFPIESASGDAAVFATGLDIEISTLAEAEAVLLMGLPDDSDFEAWEPTLDAARARDLPIYCSNPDVASPRGTETVISPGVLAFAYQDAGGRVRFYGKPHEPIFEALAAVIGTGRILMIGDSLAHDILGASQVGWDSLFLTGGLHKDRFGGEDWHAPLAAIAEEDHAPMPTYIMEQLQ